MSLDTDWIDEPYVPSRYRGKGTRSEEEVSLNFSPVDPRVKSLDDVIGLDELKEELRLQLQVWANPEGLHKLGGKARIGFVFSGPPGSGKTTSAHALAAETKKRLYTFSGTDFQAKNGKDELVRMINSLREEDAIIFVDEADDLLHKRDFRQEQSGPLVKTLLVELDQTTRNFKAFFIFATNMHPSGIDDALLHAGRLGRPLIFRNLRLSERVELLEISRKNYSVDEGVLLMPLASQMSSVPTANLAHLFDEGAFVAFRNNREQITQEDLQEAASRLRSGLERKKGWTDEELQRVAVHEAGHTIVQLVTNKSWNAVGFVQLSQRLEGDGGSTHGNDERAEEQLQTRDAVIEQIAGCLAGGQAELVILGNVSAGQSGDLASANKIADQAVADWGLGLGSASLRIHDHERYWSSDLQDDEWNSEALKLLEAGELVAKTLLRREIVALTVLVERLKESRVADSTIIKSWLSELLPMVED